MQAIRWAALVALASLCVWVLARAPAGDPLAGRDCGGCHVTSGGVAPARAGVLLASQERLCGTCHPRALKASHPTGVRPSMPVGADYPVDWKGEVTCSSCHDIHGTTHGRLRGNKRRKAFCLDCHPQTFFDRMADGGQSLVLSGHLDARADEAEPLLDPYTVQCMGCHGKNGDGSILVGGNRNSRHSGSGVNHPVGVSYVQAERAGGYRSRESLDPGIELPGGLVSCISCHRGYGAKHGAVRSPQRGSGLCLECHDL